jgi:DNA-directed RNA polymerase specialized sigma24 family protein
VGWSGPSPAHAASALVDAGAVSQVTWLLLVQHLSSLPQPERLGVWLFRTASREAYRMRRLRGCKVADTCEELSVADHPLE